MLDACYAFIVGSRVHEFPRYVPPYSFPCNMQRQNLAHDVLCDSRYCSKTTSRTKSTQQEESYLYPNRKNDKTQKPCPAKATI